MRQNVPEAVDQLVTMNTDALALLGHTMYELSLRRGDAIKLHLHKDYASLCMCFTRARDYIPFRGGPSVRLNNIRASNRISRTTMVHSFDRTSTSSGRAPSGSWSNGQQKGPPFLYKGRQWKHRPPKMSFPTKKDPRSKQT